MIFSNSTFPLALGQIEAHLYHLIRTYIGMTKTEPNLPLKTQNSRGFYYIFGETLLICS